MRGEKKGFEGKANVQKTGITYSVLANVVSALLKNQPKKGRSWPWKPAGRAPR